MKAVRAHITLRNDRLFTIDFQGAEPGQDEVKEMLKALGTGEGFLVISSANAISAYSTDDIVRIVFEFEEQDS